MTDQIEVGDYEVAARSERRAWRRGLFLLHAAAFVVVNGGLMLAYGGFVPWGWGIGLVSHALYAFGLGELLAEFEQRRARRRLDRSAVRSAQRGG